MLFRSTSLEFLPSPVDVEPNGEGIDGWTPKYVALRMSRDAIYEHAAMAYYRWKGVIKSGSYSVEAAMSHPRVIPADQKD